MKFKENYRAGKGMLRALATSMFFVILVFLPGRVPGEELGGPVAANEFVKFKWGAPAFESWRSSVCDYEFLAMPVEISAEDPAVIDRECKKLHCLYCYRNDIWTHLDTWYREREIVTPDGDTAIWMDPCAESYSQDACNGIFNGRTPQEVWSEADVFEALTSDDRSEIEIENGFEPGIRIFAVAGVDVRDRFGPLSECSAYLFKVDDGDDDGPSVSGLPEKPQGLAVERSSHDVIYLSWQRGNASSEPPQSFPREKSTSLVKSDNAFGTTFIVNWEEAGTSNNDSFDAGAVKIVAAGIDENRARCAENGEWNGQGVEVGKVTSYRLGDKPNEELKPAAEYVIRICAKNEKGTVQGEAIVARTSGYLNVYPNPFNSSVTFKYSSPDPGETVRLFIFNLKGEMVKEIHRGRQGEGMGELIWDATDKDGISVASGVYFFLLHRGREEPRRGKVTLLK